MMLLPLPVSRGFFGAKLDHFVLFREDVGAFVASVSKALVDSAEQGALGFWVAAELLC